MVEAGPVAESEDADRFEQTERPETVRVRRVLGRVEADLDVALGGEVVDLVGLHLLDDADQVASVAEVTIVQMQPRPGDVRVQVEMIDPAGVQRRGATLDAVHLVAEAEQQFGQIRSVLAGDAGDERPLHAFMPEPTPSTMLPAGHVRTCRIFMPSRCNRMDTFDSHGSAVVVNRPLGA